MFIYFHFPDIAAMDASTNSRNDHENEAKGQGSEAQASKGDVSPNQPDQSSMSSEYASYSLKDEATGQDIKLDFSETTTTKTLIEYLKSGRISINSDNIPNILAAAHSVCSEILSWNFLIFVKEHVCPTNCITYYRVSRKNKYTIFISLFREYILSHFVGVCCLSDSIEELSEEELIEIVSDDRLTAVNEDIVHDTVVRWVNADITSREGSFIKIANFIRFPFCTDNGLSNRDGYGPLKIDLTKTGLIEEAIFVRSTLMTQHSIYNQRCLPRISFVDAKKPHLLRLFVSANTHFVVCQMTECFNGRYTKWKEAPPSTEYVGGPSKGPYFVPKASSIEWILEGSTSSEFVHCELALGNDTFSSKSDWPRYSYCCYSKRNLISRLRNIASMGDQLLSFDGGQVESFHGQYVRENKLNKRATSASWRTLPHPRLPQRVNNPYFVHFTDNLYVLGGFDHTGRPSLVTQIYTSTAAFKRNFSGKQKKDMPGTCQSGAAVSLNEHIFVVGGIERVCFRYTPSSDTWLVLSQPTHVHKEFTAAAAWEGCILLWGGYHAELYNPLNDTWSPCDELVPRDSAPGFAKGLFTYFA
ncbi:hypothetical protein CAPTEDRAFT_220736 [Capitella teleta]|uniref:BACK domain-containing protein n=1 Tax=Capitella teleta TaxID=283909 RepID=R7TLE7_CAPTE|nr:hypothetical protein CAPTEDRAFT_220736 [Capitella teleta]|eukprot:ELT92366.1 hypothetical protein CAPTEDRAFT_220736 [Capitella teleta]